jgi:hypothetical protein
MQQHERSPAAFPNVGIATGVEDGDDEDVCRFDRVEDAVSESRHNCFPDILVDNGVKSGIRCDSGQGGTDRVGETLSDTRPLFC